MKIMLKDVRISFPVLNKAKDFKGNGKFKYSATLLLDKVVNAEAVLSVKQAMAQAAKEKFKDDAKDVFIKLEKTDKLCLRDGEDKNNHAGFSGCYYLNASSTTRPLVLDKSRTKLDENQNVIYSGCYVNAQIEVWAQDNNWGKRINATLCGVQFKRDGDALSGSAPAKEDDFELVSEVSEGDLSEWLA